MNFSDPQLVALGAVALLGLGCYMARPLLLGRKKGGCTVEVGLGLIGVVGLIVLCLYYLTGGG